MKTVFVFPPLRKHRAGQHDQSTHGSWATNESFNAGNGLSMGEIYDLHEKNDSQVRKLYDAEAEALSEIQPSWKHKNPPVAPSLKDHSNADYKKLYRKYKEEFYRWKSGKNAHIESSLGKELLDGSTKGVKKYIESVIRSDWFLKEYGVGSTYKYVMHFPDVAMTDSQSSLGKYVFGKTNGRVTSRIQIDKGFAQNEPLLLHEISHYANSISVKGNFQGHGKEYAGNYLKLTRKFMPEYTDSLERNFTDMGVDYDV